jgi:hypothetical protein
VDPSNNLNVTYVEFSEFSKKMNGINLEFLGSPVESLGSLMAKNVVIFLHGSGDTGRGVKV